MRPDDLLQDFMCNSGYRTELQTGALIPITGQKQKNTY